MIQQFHYNSKSEELLVTQFKCTIQINNEQINNTHIVIKYSINYINKTMQTNYDYNYTLSVRIQNKSHI